MPEDPREYSEVSGFIDGGFEENSNTEINWGLGANSYYDYDEFNVDRGCEDEFLA